MEDEVATRGLGNSRWPCGGGASSFDRKGKSGRERVFERGDLLHGRIESDHFPEVFERSSLVTQHCMDRGSFEERDVVRS